MAANSNRGVTVGNLEHFLGKCRGEFAAKSPATTTAAGLMSASDKSDLDALVSWKNGLVNADTQSY